MVSGVGDLTFTGLVFSWFLLTGEEQIKDWSYNYMMHKTFGQVIVQAQV